MILFCNNENLRLKSTHFVSVSPLHFHLKAAKSSGGRTKHTQINISLCAGRRYLFGLTTPISVRCVHMRRVAVIHQWCLPSATYHCCTSMMLQYDCYQLYREWAKGAILPYVSNLFMGNRHSYFCTHRLSFANENLIIAFTKFYILVWLSWKSPQAIRDRVVAGATSTKHTASARNCPNAFSLSRLHVLPIRSNNHFSWHLMLLVPVQLCWDSVKVPLNRSTSMLTKVAL